MTNEELKILEELPQFPSGDKGTHGELHIGKNDPKNGQPDYWWCSYGDIYIFDQFYSLPAMLSKLVEECKRMGYVETDL
jgi:hypothetical protein